MKEYTFITAYTVKAPDEAKARETVDKVESQLSPDEAVIGTEHFTRLIDIADSPEEEEE